MVELETKITSLLQEVLGRQIELQCVKNGLYRGFES